MWKDFFEGLAQLQESRKPFVVATVMKVSGSTYRRPGARVLITEDGVSTGLISGGCFEGELIERARQVLRSRKPELVTFDTTSPDDLIFGLGLGCTGVAQILMEPFPSSTHYLEFISRLITQRQPGVVATVFRSETPAVSVGGRMMVKDEDGHFVENIQNSEIVKILYQESVSVLKTGETKVHQSSTSTGQFEALIESIELPLPLVIFGAGPDAVPLVRFGKELGWDVTVVDRRPAFARKDRFDSANSVILSEPESLSSNLELDSETAVVIMTHNFESDKNFLKQVLSSPVFYIGLLGPTAKTELLMEKLREEGFQPTHQQLLRVHSPVGLDIGAETPEEIALSIVSEIQAVRNGYSGGPLRTRSGPIHRRDRRL